MILHRKSDERRHVGDETYDEWETFDPENPVDPMRHGFRALVSLKQSDLHPGTTVLPRAHRSEVDCVTYVRDGILMVQETSARLGRLESGEFRRTDIRGAQAIVWPLDRARIVQIYIAARTGAAPSEPDRRRFLRAERKGVLRLVASPDRRESTLGMRKEVFIYSSLLDPGTHVVHELEQGRRAWVHVVEGRIELIGHSLREGDGAAVEEELAVSMTAAESCEILLIDLP